MGYGTRKVAPPLEPEAEGLAAAWVDRKIDPGMLKATLSIAISLKRLADAVDQIGLGNPDASAIIHGFITNMAHEAGMAFQNGVNRNRS